MENPMNVNPDVLEEVKELLEHGLERHSWPFVEDALALLKEELGYEPDSDDDEERYVEEE